MNLEKYGILQLEKVIIPPHWSQSDIVNFTESMTDVDNFGMFPEGWVIYDKHNTPIAKIKRSIYVQMHHVSGGDTLHTRNVVIASYFTGTLDDIYGHLIDPMQEFADKLQDKIKDLFGTVKSVLDEIEGMEFETQKDYAMAVQAKAPKRFVCFFFQEKNKILDERLPNSEIFEKWITLNYTKFESFWKDKVEL